MLQPTPVCDLRGTNGAQKISDSVGDLLRFQPIDNAVPLPAFGNQIRILQDREMTGDRRARDGKTFGDFPSGQIFPFQLLQDLTAGGIRQSAKGF